MKPGTQWRLICVYIAPIIKSTTLGDPSEDGDESQVPGLNVNTTRWGEDRMPVLGMFVEAT